MIDVTYYTNVNEYFKIPFHQKENTFDVLNVKYRRHNHHTDKVVQ